MLRRRATGITTGSDLTVFSVVWNACYRKSLHAIGRSHGGGVFILVQNLPYHSWP